MAAPEVLLKNAAPRSNSPIMVADRTRPLPPGAWRPAISPLLPMPRLLGMLGSGAVRPMSDGLAKQYLVLCGHLGEAATSIDQALRGLH